MQNHLNNNNRNHYKWSLIILLTIFFTGCNDNTERSTESKAGDLVSVTQLSTHSKQTIITVLGNVATQITPAYSVDNYKVVYKTKDTKGNLINVSGLMALPQKIMAASSPRLSIQHGTIFLDQQAPSFNHQAGSNSVIAASLGFIVTAPDYIGYGESAGQTHPHSHKDTLACAGIDLLRASKSWLEQQQIAENGQLFIAGYSEGGYATLAMQKVIQTELFNEFTVTASVPAAGSYDLTRASKRDPDEPAFTFVFIAYIIKAYDEVYGLNILADAIRPEYLDVVNTHFDGTRSGAQISALLPPTDSPADSFFNRAFLQKFNNGELPALSNRIAENNLHDWIPTAATRFFQAREDKIVAFEPVVQMVQTMRGNGATDIELIECYAGGLATTHDNCFFPALIYSAGFFSTLARDL